MPKYYYITGPDGCGKTTYINKIQSHFNNKNIKNTHIWLRSPKIFSKPLMAYCRIVGLTKYNNIDGMKYGGHEFYLSRIVSWLFPILQLIDFKIKLLFFHKKILSNKIVLFDRFALDTLADLMVDTRRFDLHKTCIGKAFTRMIPKDTKIVTLRVGENTIRERKPDTKYDPHLSNKIKVYSILAKELGIEEIDNSRNTDIVENEIFQKFGLNERD